ncbi:hypothetical protein [Pseudoxanthomonas sp. JBR18]|uniref:hypothetical protein n=1 Tax=Pseudoxanthomonas sp. JBR18 TaxID=2969308 RepID=UPI002306A0DC|nr:hypothetical protein [Pseudoxanthomonas sp. JBR18]WCE05186.1 hypothetical protein PJ250_04180 [Pseudoxanthomonas sp. JBR18]
MKRSLPAGRFWIDLFIVAFSLASISFLSSGFFNAADFAAWSGDPSALVSCFTSIGAGPCDGISKFPFAYLVNAYVVVGSEQRLALLNGLAILVPVLCLGWLSGWRMMLRGGSIYLMAIALSPLPGFYVRSGALEVQAGVVSGIYIACLSGVLFQGINSRSLFRIRVLLVVSGLLLPLYKDTIVLLVGLSVLVACLIKRFSFEHARKQLTVNGMAALVAYAALPVVVGIGLSLVYNILRYDSPLPVAYMNEAAQTTPTVARSFEFFLGSIMSPNGGVVVFWALPLSVAIFGWRLQAVRFQGMAAIVSGGAALLSCIAFARWWAPFGWDAWGDRLMIQPVLAILVALLMSLEPASKSVGGQGGVGSWFFAFPVLVASTYYAVIPYFNGRGEAFSQSLWSGPACTEMMHRLQTDAPAMGFSFWKTEDYYACARERMLHVPSTGVR